MSDAAKVLATFDLESFQSMIDVWRAALDVMIPMKDEFKIHMIANRRNLLLRQRHAAEAFSLMFRCMEGEISEMESIRKIIDDYRDWTEQELRQMNEL